MGLAAHRSIDTGRPVLWSEMLDEFEAARAQYGEQQGSDTTVIRLGRHAHKCRNKVHRTAAPGPGPGRTYGTRAHPPWARGIRTRGTRAIEPLPQRSERTHMSHHTLSVCACVWGGQLVASLSNVLRRARLMKRLHERLAS
eukprot:scaffold86816_cov58-Phaeocystis_antarctica.AAC.7